MRCKIFFPLPFLDPICFLRQPDPYPLLPVREETGFFLEMRRLRSRGRSRGSGLDGVNRGEGDKKDL